MSEVVRTHNLTKYYGSHLAVYNVNLAVREGEVFGYLGPNGAGKTTTIRTLLDFIRPTGGSASILGLDTRQHSREIRRRVDYLPGDMVMYENMNGGELLHYLANLRGGVEWRFVEELTERLQCNLSQPIRALSRGNKQKIGLIQAFMKRPELIIMDEPTSGLDPLMQQEFYRMVEEVKAEGRTVFLSSHNLPEVEKVCDRVGIIRRGELITVEDVHVLKERALHQLEFHFATPVPQEEFIDLPRIHRRTSLGTALEEASGCSSESGIMVLEQKPARKQGAPNRCCHRTNPTVSASSLTTIAWWPMPACSCRPL